MKVKNGNSPRSIDFDDADEQCICFNLRKAARVITQIYDEAFQPTGCRATQMPLLVATRAMGPVTVNRLAEAVVMDRTTLTRNLKPLERQGLVKVQTGKDHREREDHSVDLHVRLSRKRRRARRDQHPYSEKGNPQAHDASESTEDDVLRQELAQEPSAPSPHRQTDGHFALPGEGAREQEVRDVHAGDEEDQQDRSTHQEQTGAHVADDGFMERLIMLSDYD